MGLHGAERKVGNIRVRKSMNGLDFLRQTAQPGTQHDAYFGSTSNVVGKVAVSFLKLIDHTVKRSVECLQ